MTSSRVDLQVVVVVALFTAITCITTASFYWNYTFSVMMNSLEERALSLYLYIETHLADESFTNINGPEDMESELYQTTMETMMELKNATGVLYLYTAKINDQGEFVYVIDGLEQDLDFRYPNDPIEGEIIPDMYRALGDQVVMPEEIVHTDWGDIFISYMPFHSQEGEVLGVVGIEFDASEIYATLIQLRQITPVIIAFVVLLSAFLSIRLFRRVSNPLYIDRNTRDFLTGLKNRNAYEVDLQNLEARGNMEKVGIIVADINGLKEVNDRLGHISGDHYISLVAEAIHEHKTKDMVAYRTGGDEFVIVARDATVEILDRFVRKTSAQVKNQKKYTNMRCSLACGFTVYDETTDERLETTFRRADQEMYEEKRRQKEQQKR